VVNKEAGMAKADLKLINRECYSFERRFAMKKLTYMKPKVVGSANVHPC
jgi:hypothetical protein